MTIVVKRLIRFPIALAGSYLVVFGLSLLEPQYDQASITAIFSLAVLALVAGIVSSSTLHSPILAFSGGFVGLLSALLYSPESFSKMWTFIYSPESFSDVFIIRLVLLTFSALVSAPIGLLGSRFVFVESQPLEQRMPEEISQVETPLPAEKGESLPALQEQPAEEASGDRFSCSNCGFEVPGQAVFCPNCGSKLK